MKIAVFSPTMHGGGAERQMLLLASELSKRGHDIDLVLSKRRGPLLSLIPGNINVVVLQYRGLVTIVKALAHYLLEARPAAMITAMPQANGYSIWARFISGVATRVILTERNSESEVLGFKDSADRRVSPKTWLKFQLIRHSYRFADALVGVSNGVAARLQELPGVEQYQVHTIYNGLDTSSIAKEIANPVADPWFDDKRIPIVLGAGRLEKQKDFSTLIMAFDFVRKVRPARLIMLGEGGERPQLENLVIELGLTDLVRLPGFTINPYAYMARASVFVLSSRHEGFANVLLEALACGTPVVSTDCPSGPREILERGRYGRLVPVGDADALARAMIKTLDNPPPPESLKERAREFSIEACADSYLKLICSSTFRCD